MDLGQFGFGHTTPAKLFCPTHGEYQGWVMVIDGQRVESECDACAKERSIKESNEVSARIFAAQERAKLDQQRDRITASCIPPRFLKKSFADWKTCCSESKAVRAKAADYVLNFEEMKKNGTSLLLIGRSGTGKTHLAAAIANNIIIKGYSAMYITSLNFISRVKRAWTSTAIESEDQIIESFMIPDLLIIDELGKGELDRKEKAMLFRLINRRYEEEKPMIGISTHLESKLADLIDQDSVRRLKSGGGAKIEFTWNPFE